MEASCDGETTDGPGSGCAGAIFYAADSHMTGQTAICIWQR